MGSTEQYGAAGRMQSRNTYLSGLRPGLSTDGIVRIDSAIQQFFTWSVADRKAAFDSINKLWNELLPRELCQHSKIIDIAGGLLKVQADSPSFLYELQLCSSQLLAVMQKQCPSLRIKKIKIILA